jgi:hypothetical protein
MCEESNEYEGCFDEGVCCYLKQMLVQNIYTYRVVSGYVGFVLILLLILTFSHGQIFGNQPYYYCKYNVSHEERFVHATHDFECPPNYIFLYGGPIPVDMSAWPNGTIKIE